MKYRPEIDGLRAIAVIPVLLFHAGFKPFSGGFVGVDVFFVISGYLITTILLQEAEKGTYSILSFYERRARRILPAMFFVMLCSFPFAYKLMLPAELENFAMSSVAVTMFVSNLFFWRQGGYFSGNLEEQPLLHTWSLAVEEQFYILFPLALMFLLPLGKRWVFVGLIAISILSISIAEWGHRASATANFYLLPSRAWELMGGALCAVYLLHREPRKIQWMSIVGFAMIVYSVVYFDRGTPFPSLFTLVPVVGTILIILTSGATIVGRTLSRGLFVSIGLWSYSIYLWHQPLLAFARISGETTDLLLGSLLVVSIALGWFTWRFVEKPFRGSSGFSFPKLAFILSAGFLTINLGAIATISQDGFLNRYPADNRWLVSMDPKTQGDYVSNSFWERQFSFWEEDSKKRRVLIIGDSFAQDFTNTLLESPLSENIQISTYHIKPGCGNLFVGRDFSEHIPKQLRSQCAFDGWYSDPRLLKVLNGADVVWLASHWSSWEADYLAESLLNIKQRSAGAAVLVVGRKNFGRIDIKSLIAVDPADRVALMNTVRASVIETNTRIQQVLSDEEFVDLHKTLCPEKLRCRIFSNERELISYDGDHLTESGARHVGQILLGHPLVQEIFQIDVQSPQATPAAP